MRRARPDELGMIPPLPGRQQLEGEMPPRSYRKHKREDGRIRQSWKSEADH